MALWSCVAAASRLARMPPCIALLARALGLHWEEQLACAHIVCWGSLCVKPLGFRAQAAAVADWRPPVAAAAAATTTPAVARGAQRHVRARGRACGEADQDVERP
eukprot:CAMPEP_0115339196 /NCGR_PEP_ID=MMETSP0270-20121206/90481_1 /TAXON_ID=71861 /ORGANISM="Scrippsiella trochoidea, Strain CCMP3099" /LENGTH=104 /DNA_ID=CAMNT_0002760561 /DNA_START=36 /DNA_END=348 /DNA_ORIENTATION=+